MFIRFNSFLVLTAFIVATKATIQECSEKEHFNPCGSACEPTCMNPNPTICTRQCKLGCTCITGLVRNQNGECVKIEDCPRISTFDFAFQQIKCPPGTVQTSEGSCIIASSMNQCGKNMEFRKCGTLCEPVCGKETPTICPLMCVSGCFCKKGYIFDKYGNCITQRECENLEPTREKCKENEYFNPCGSACEPTCENPNPNVCTDNCVYGCTCKEGFVRNHKGKCVKLEDCREKSLFGRM